MGRIRQIEDAHSDPDLIAARYRVGRSAFFEVELAMAEFGALVSSTRSLGGTQGSSTVIIGDPPIFDDGGDRDGTNLP